MVQYRYDPERVNTWISNYSSSAYVTDNISDNATWQVTDNTSMVLIGSMIMAHL